MSIVLVLALLFSADVSRLDLLESSILSTDCSSEGYARIPPAIDSIHSIAIYAVILVCDTNAYYHGGT